MTVYTNIRYGWVLSIVKNKKCDIIGGKRNKKGKKGTWVSNKESIKLRTEKGIKNWKT